MGASLAHNPGDGFLEVFEGPTVQGSVMVDVTILNPEISSGQEWEHGLLLRARPSNTFHVVRLRGDGSWVHAYRLGQGQPNITLRQEVSEAIDRDATGKNHLRLVAIGPHAWLFINGQSQGVLDLSKIHYDRIHVALGREIEGAVTPFEKYTIWTWHPSLTPLPEVDASASGTQGSSAALLPFYGPTSGTIPHEIEKPTNFFEVFSGPQVDGDLMADVTYVNPDADVSEGFSYGFLLRSAKSNAYHWVYIAGSQWFQVLMTPDTQFRHEVRNRRSADINTNPGGENHLRVVIVGDDAWFFINGEYQSTLNLRTLTDPAPVRLVVNDEGEGATRFKGFTVWNWDPSLQELPE